MMVPALFFAATILECGPAPLEHGLVCGLAHVGLGPLRRLICRLLLLLVWSWFLNPRRWGSCLRGCYGGQGLHLGHPHGVRVECCNGASLCGSHPHEQWRRFCGSLLLVCVATMRRLHAAAAIVGTSVVMTAAARSAAFKRLTCLSSLLVSTFAGSFLVKTAAARTAALQRWQVVVVAFSFCFQPFDLRFQPFVFLALCVASSFSRRQRSCVKGCVERLQR